VPTVLDHFREWRIDRMTDRIARRPHGRQARKTYGAADAHSFTWEPVLEALALGPDDRCSISAAGAVSSYATRRRRRAAR